MAAMDSCLDSQAVERLNRLLDHLAQANQPQYVSPRHGHKQQHIVEPREFYDRAHLCEPWSPQHDSHKPIMPKQPYRQLSTHSTADLKTVLDDWADQLMVGDIW
jgi:hypothetical protein